MLLFPPSFIYLLKLRLILAVFPQPNFPGVAIPKTRGGSALQNLSASNFLPAQKLSKYI